MRALEDVLWPPGSLLLTVLRRRVLCNSYLMFLELVFHVVFCILLLVIYMLAIVDKLPRFGKRELIYLLLFTCNYVFAVRRGFLFLWLLGMGYVILLWQTLSLPYNYFAEFDRLPGRHKALLFVSLY